MSKRHYLIKYEEEIGYITACNLKYKDSDNINLTGDWGEVNCKECLSKLKGRYALPKLNKTGDKEDV